MKTSLFIVTFIYSLTLTTPTKEIQVLPEFPVIKIHKVLKVTATVYNAEPKQCNKDCFTTASMFKLDLKDQYQHRIIAVSQDLLKEFKMGDTVVVTGTKIYDGKWIVNDKMNKRYKKRIDFLINKGMKIGKWNNIKIYKL